MQIGGRWCNSSRLHLGGKVVLLLEIANARGAVVSRLQSDRLQLCSKSSLQVFRPNVSVECAREAPVPLWQGDEVVFVFDRCRSWCNSSRLHLGGKVVLLLEIANARGAVVSRLQSDRLQLCSKSALQVFRWCNSSRLHLGGEVVLLLEIANARGAVVSRLQSDRLQLCSKSALQVFRSRSSPAPVWANWVAI
eukprot:m51a1_g1956 hypothetical protein (193) ;mRNA; r:1027965-1049094